MFKVVGLQAGAVLVVAIIAGWLAGERAAWSAVAGGAAYLLPGLLFVVRLRVAIATQRAGAVGFLVGEAVKLAAVIAVLILLPRFMELNWPALLAGLSVVLFANLFALLLKN